MNPDVYSPEYQMMLADRARAEAFENSRRTELHRKAVARRRKAKRGGKK